MPASEENQTKSMTYGLLWLKFGGLRSRVQVDLLLTHSVHCKCACTISRH